MPNYRRARIQGGTYFFTVVTYRRQRFLCNPDVRLALRKAIEATQKACPFSIEAWVMLPDHLHCIWTLPEQDCDFSKRWALIKRFVVQQLGPTRGQNGWITDSKNRRNESTVWQRRFWEHSIRDEADYLRHIHYIHYNPVKHGLVRSVKDWPFSTFHKWVRKSVYHEHWGGTGEQMEGEVFGE